MYGVFDETLTKVKENYPVVIYFFKRNSGNTRSVFKIWSKLTMNTPERRQWHRKNN